MERTNYKLVNTAATAEMLGVSVETLNIWRCTKRYKLDYHKIGSRVMYYVSDVEDFIESRKISMNGGCNDTKH